MKNVEIRNGADLPFLLRYGTIRVSISLSLSMTAAKPI
jgi:hypothetical protein